MAEKQKVIRFEFGKQILKDRYNEDLSWCELDALARHFFDAWGYGNKITPEEYLRVAREECGINIEDIPNQALIYDNFRYKMREVQILEKLITNHKKLDMMFDDSNTYGSVLKNMLIVVGNGLHCILSLRAAMMGLQPSFDSAMTDDQRLLSVKVRNVQEYLPFEMLIRYTLEYIQKLGYRRYHEDIYQSVVTESGENTNAWSRVMEIQEVVHHLVDKDENEDIWRLLYNAGNYHKLSEYLKVCHEYEFPDLEKDRTVFSFKNGVYNASEDKFYKFGRDKLSDDVIACKYFDREFIDLTDREWNEIPTPSFESILEYQLGNKKEYDDILRTAYILIGRMLYDAGEHDDWQVIPFFKGLAQTGKSTILRMVIKAFYETADVGNLSNDCAEKFPIENLYDKFIYIAPDIDEHFHLPQMLFQGMVSGEDVSIMRKNKTPVDMVWKAQGALAGNELFGYRDNGNSIGRRIVLFEFGNILTTTQLKKDLAGDLKEEIPKILIKCNKAYRQAVQEWGRQNVWEHLPNYFIVNRDYLLEQTNTLLQFLKSERIVFQENSFIPQDQFVIAYQAFCKEYCLSGHKFNKDLYTAPFAICEAKLQYPMGLVKDPVINSNHSLGFFVQGVSFKGQNNEALVDSD